MVRKAPLFLTLLLLLTLCGCGKSIPASTTPTEKSQELLDFTATDLSGNIVHFSDFHDTNIVLLYFWEPWSVPSVGQLEILQSLYTKHQDDGFLPIGVFQSTGLDNEIQSVIEENEITFPVIRGEDARLIALQTVYTPTAVIVNAAGETLSKTPIIGAHTEKEWEVIIQNYL